MLKSVRINQIKKILARMGMHGKYERDYTARHERIRNKLMEMTKECDCGCVTVPKIAAELRMDQRTVRAHLKIIEIDNAGVFLDPEEKEFCTKEGLTLLVNRLGLKEIAAEQKS